MAYDSGFFTSAYPTSLLDDLGQHLRKRSLMDSRIPKFVFVCGEQMNPERITNRERVASLLGGHTDVRVLMAEELWIKSAVDLLTFEQFMAHISDLVVLFVESSGTAAELGSFATVDVLIPKLLIYDDKKYRDKESFINNGPLKRIQTFKESGTIVFGNIESAMESSEMLSRLLSLVGQSKRVEINDNPSRLLSASYCVEVLDLVYMLGPMHKSEVFHIYKYLKGFQSVQFDVKLITPIFFVDFLARCGLLTIDKAGFVSVIPELVPQNLMLFNLTNRAFDQYRLKFLARKFKYAREYDRFAGTRRQAS